MYSVKGIKLRHSSLWTGIDYIIANFKSGRASLTYFDSSTQMIFGIIMSEITILHWAQPSSFRCFSAKTGSLKAWTWWPLLSSIILITISTSSSSWTTMIDVMLHSLICKMLVYNITPTITCGYRVREETPPKSCNGLKSHNLALYLNWGIVVT